MGNYATDYAAVQPRLGGRTLTAAAAPTPSSVTQEMVNAWITEAEAILDAHLKAAGLTTPVTDANGKLVLKPFVVSQVAARAIRAWELGTRLDEGSGRPADLEVAEWQQFIALIQAEPGRVATMMGQPFGTSVGKGQLRSYVTDNTDGKSVGNGDFDPHFTRDKKW